MSIRKTFSDSRLQRDFDRNGYVRIAALDAADIARLQAVLARHEAEYSQPFHTSHFSTGTHYKREVHQAIIDVVFPRLAPQLTDFRPIFGNLMIKNGMNDAFMPLHADWTYVDESEYRSISAWIPLVDTNEENGCLGVIAGSHRVSSQIRGPRIAQSSYRHDKEWVKKFGTLVPVRAGDAIIFDHALMHYSPPNRTSLSRPALNLSMIPSGADIYHYCIPEGASDIEVYRVDDSEFYLQYNNYQRPETNSLLRTQPASTVSLIDERMEKFNPSAKSNILQRLGYIYHRLSR